MHPSILLLRQAVGLHLSPSPATGVAVMVENRNMLHIPMEVPEPRPPPPRRGPRAPPPSSVPPLERNTVRPFHIKQLSAQAQNMNLPDLARGLLDRGESLGINRTSFFSAVSELRVSIEVTVFVRRIDAVQRNLPDIAASAASLIKTPSMNTPPAFPLLDESTPEERPPWEPKSRREMEQELDELKASQRRLGQSVGWIVDALLQSEGGDHDDEAVQKIRKRKQDALESLSYVRDVLQGHVASIDEERLWDDVELQRRKYQTTQADSEATAALPSSPPVTAGVAVPTPSAPLPIVAGTASRPRPFMPRFSPPIPTPLSPSPTPSTSSILPVELKPNANATPLAPWKYTRSNFSAPVSSVTPPPPTSAALPKSPPLAPPKPSILAPVSTSNVRHETVAMTPTRSSGPGEPAARKQAVEYDPLGALH
jgi:TBC1 domain family protein 5